MKSCRRCGIEKPLTEFYKHSQMADGHLNYCKDCKRTDSIIHRNSNIAHYRAYDRRRANEPQRVQSRENYSRSEAGKASQSRAKASHIARTPIARKAHVSVGNAVRDGKLQKQPCEVCGSIKKIHAHHDDYTKPLDVRWLCAIHHAEWHKTNTPKFG